MSVIAPTHPCPKPALRPQSYVDGLMWACACGRIYVLRLRANHHGERPWWQWIATSLRTTEGVTPNGKIDLWNTPTTSSGRFEEAKRSGDIFRGAKRED